MRVHSAPGLIVRVALVALLAVPAGAEVQEAIEGPLAAPEKIDLCDALATVGNGEVLHVRVSGVYVAGMLFDPEEPRCSLDIQPSTWVEFSSQFSKADRERLSQAASGTGYAGVEVEGFLHGPPHPGPGIGNSSAPELLDYLERIRGRRYGQDNAFRTKLVVESLIRAWEAPAEVRGETLVSRQYGPQGTPDVLASALPIYPLRARRIGIQGEVVLLVQVDEGVVFESVVLSGDRLFHQDAIAFVRSWRLDPRWHGQFETTIEYRLERRAAGADDNPRIEFELPRRTRITARRNDW